MRRFAVLALLCACSPSKSNSEPEKPQEAITAIPVHATSHSAPEVAKSAADESEQTFKEGMQIICDSINKVDAALDPSDQQRAVASWIDRNVTNEQVRELFSIIGQVAPSKRAGMMSAAATKAGISECAIANE